jgi:dephospho-CoA kinase
MTRPFIIGLTGSIGMGKTTTAGFFAERGVPVWNADGVVHALYAQGGKAVGPIEKIAPQAIQNGGVDRAILREMIAREPALLERINAAVHPLVAQDRQDFLETTTAPLVLLDVPLLFETGADRLCDAVAVVSVAPEIQKARVMDRGSMSEDEFDLILSRQMPDADKRALARWVIDTSTHETAREGVDRILAEVQHA